MYRVECTRLVFSSGRIPLDVQWEEEFGDLEGAVEWMKDDVIQSIGETQLNNLSSCSYIVTNIEPRSNNEA